MNIQLLSIRSNHVDFFCRDCCTAFGLRENDYIICPKCQGNRKPRPEPVPVCQKCEAVKRIYDK